MNLTSLNELSVEDINNIFKTTDGIIKYKNRPLLGKTFILFFPESSIRTRLTFEKGIDDLGGRVILFPPTTLDKPEEIKDVVKYIENWADGIIVRHPDYNKILEMTKYSNIPIINAMTSINHPCEILSDLYSISKKKNNYKDLTYTFVGENGNIAKSWMNVAKKINLKFNHISTIENRIKEDDENYKFYTDLEFILPETDVVLTDPLSKKSKNKDYYDKYQITMDRMNQCRQDSILNPCPPFYRGEEISHKVIDSKYFVGYDFKKRLINIQQAILLYCLGI